MAGPPGWPREVLPPDAEGWEASAVGWLLDLCPPDHRGYPVLRRHPVVLAYVAHHHLRAQLSGSRSAIAGLRAALGAEVPPEALTEALAALEREQVRLQAAGRGVDLVADALRGRRHRPRL